LTLAMLILSSVPGFAQTVATLVGRTVDANGDDLPGVRVTATNTETGAARTTTSDDTGRFTIAGLPVGDYTVRAELNGFRPLVRSGVRLNVAQQAAVVLELQVGATEVVTVVGGASLVNTRSAELSYLVDQRTRSRSTAVTTRT
jgi:hypothetical protein